MNSDRPKLKHLVTLMRPRQWVKNGFVFMPLVFSGNLGQYSAIAAAALAFLYFCLASSFVYVLNDLQDVEADRQHPIKSKKRPIAAGWISEKQAYALLGLLLFLILTSLVWQWQLSAVLAGYVLLNVCYSFYLKHQPILDIFSIATGFVLRVYAGAVVLLLPLSPLMFITTFCLALYLAAIKRRQELLLNKATSRKVLQRYSQSLVDRYAEMSAIGALLFYSLFTILDQPRLMITIPFVMFGLFRYWLVVETLDKGESPTDVLLTDLPIILTVILWLLLSIALMLTG